LSRDGWLLFITCGVRSFAYGFLSVILGLYLDAVGLSTAAIGWIFTAALAGGAMMTILITAIADSFGRKTLLIVGAVLMAAAGWIFAVSGDPIFLTIAAIFGTISPSGKDVGPFLSIEQAILPQTTDNQHRTAVFSAYNLVGSFAGGFIVQSIVAYWFYLRFKTDLTALGAIFFGTNLLAAVSFLAAPAIARRFGLLNTMVFTHLPSNFLILLVPLMPNVELAVVVLMIRHLLSQMDVPTRQSYTMAVVEPDERAASAGILSVARNAGAALAPLFTGAILTTPSLGLPFLLAGGLKIIYDLWIFAVFRNVKPPEEKTQAG